MTSGQDVSGTGPGRTPSSGGAGGPPGARRRRVLLAVVGLALLAALAVAVYALRRKPEPPSRVVVGADVWSVSRQAKFRRECLEEARWPLPVEAQRNDAVADRYCTCTTGGLAAAFPSFSAAGRALAQDPARRDGDGQRAAEVLQRCLASSR